MNKKSDRQYKILIVDDDPTSTAILKNFLEQDYYTFLTSKDSVIDESKGFYVADAFASEK